MAKDNKISGQFAARLIEMMESPAYRVLSLSAHRALSRIEIEWAHHGGQDNGRLPVTFDDFVAYGLHRTAIGPALVELEALGFIVVTDQGKMAHAADYRRPKKFLLTSRPVPKGADPLHNWKRITTMEEAQAIAESARKLSGEKKKEPVRKPYQKPVRKTYHKGQIASTENVPLRMSETVPLSISRVGTPHLDDADGAGPPSTPHPPLNADDAPTPRLTQPPAPPSPAVLWAKFSPSRPRQPASVGIAAPRKPAPDAIVEPIDGSYLIGGRRINVLDQTARRNVVGLAVLHERPARRTAHPSNADKPVRPRLAVIAGAPTHAIAAE
jgi:hypothetical protein